MRVRGIGAVAVLVLALSGCSDEGDNGGGLEGEGGMTGTTTGSSTQTGTTTSTASPAPTSGPEPTENETAGATQEFAGSLSFQGESCVASRAYAATGSVPLGNPLDGVSRLVFDVDPLTIGQDYTLTWAFDQGYIEVSTFFTDAAGTIVSQRVADSPNFGGLTMTGMVPEGAAVAVLFACGGPVEASAVYLSAP
jgi:hypothetical protein